MWVQGPFRACPQLNPPDGLQATWFSCHHDSANFSYQIRCQRNYFVEPFGGIPTHNWRWTLVEDLTHADDKWRELAEFASSKISNERARDAEPAWYWMIPEVRRGGVWNDFSEKKGSLIGMKDHIKIGGLQVYPFFLVILAWTWGQQEVSLRYFLHNSSHLQFFMTSHVA